MSYTVSSVPPAPLLFFYAAFSVSHTYVSMYVYHLGIIRPSNYPCAYMETSMNLIRPASLEYGKEKLIWLSLVCEARHPQKVSRQNRANGQILLATVTSIHSASHLHCTKLRHATGTRMMMMIMIAIHETKEGEGRAKTKKNTSRGCCLGDLPTSSTTTVCSVSN